MLHCAMVLLAAVLAAAAPAAPRAAGDLVLLDFEAGFDAAAVVAADARASVVRSAGGPALAVATGRADPFPGVTLKAPAGSWDLSKYEYVALDVANAGRSDVAVNLRVDNRGADGTSNCCTDRVALRPGETRTLKVFLRRRPAGPQGVKLFGMRGYPVPQDARGTIDPAAVTQLVVFVARPSAEHHFQIDNVRAGGAYAGPQDRPVPAEQFFPFIDRFGQYVHRQWPGKIASAADMAERRAQEAADLKARPGPRDGNQYGGWKAGPLMPATAFFRAEKHQGKWWLVDPEGRLFWSHGIDCVIENGATPIDDRDNWFADLPAGDPEFKEFFGRAHAIKGYYTGRTIRTFDFVGANLKRKYGPNWRQLSAETAHKRIRSWGMNTIANWSHPEIYLMRKTPYTANASFSSRPIVGSQGYWGQFKDPFAPEFAARARAAMAAHAGRGAGDPWCIGFFVDNEIAWGDDVSLALAALQSPPDQPAKQAFIDDLKARYQAIDKLNAAWGTSHASWDALAQSTAAPDKKRAAEDLGAFYSRLAEQYFRICRQAVKEVAPKQLYLGCRFAWVNNRAAAAAAKYCDVVSYNQYRRSVAEFRLPGGADMPVIVGEFHFGALDRGMFHTGLVACASQAERAAAYKDYLRGALAHPQFVGTHWFKYQDQPATGRPLDEENYQIGFVDVCDTPYPETVAACREVASDMYKFRLDAK